MSAECCGGGQHDREQGYSWLTILVVGALLLAAGAWWMWWES